MLIRAYSQLTVIFRFCLPVQKPRGAVTEPHEQGLTMGWTPEGGPLKKR
jgi:hypothetical protein